MKKKFRKTLSRIAAPVRLGIREFLDKGELKRLQIQSVESENLRRLDCTGLAEQLEDVSIAGDWQIDSAALSRVNPPDHASGVNLGDQRALYTLVRSFQPLRILEVGTHIGSSTLAIALASARNVADGLTPHVSTIDIRDVNDVRSTPWEYFGSDASPRQKLEELGLDGLVDFQVGDSLRILSETKEEYDFIFLDGNHRAPAVYKEISVAVRKLGSGGSIVMHDVFPGGRPLWRESRATPGPWQAVSRLMDENPELRLLPFGELPWSTKYGGRVTSLATLSVA